jgi:hypothetical protein
MREVARQASTLSLCARYDPAHLRKFQPVPTPRNFGTTVPCVPFAVKQCPVPEPANTLNQSRFPIRQSVPKIPTPPLNMRTEKPSGRFFGMRAPTPLARRKQRCEKVEL